MKQYIGDTCEVTCENNGKKIVAEVLDLQEKIYLSVSLNRSLKLELRWNGNVYEGRQSGLTFVTQGPIIKTAKTSLRG
jgi:hypothetical protein